MELAEVGAYTDERTGLRGVNRLALTDADAEGRRLVKRWMEEAGLEVRVDAIGNTYGRRAGARPDAAPVMSGSHIDSVPTGGAFDGALGVIGALEVVRSLNDRGIVTERPIEIAFFTDEEGARFGTDMLGSATACGRIALDQAFGLTDRDGKRVEDELRRIGFVGEAPVELSPPHAYVELHIEQGPVLAREEMDLGVVTGVQAISWQEVTITGKACHAGTTPMELRQDAGLAAARLNVELHRLAGSGEVGEAMRVTMGRIEPRPNQVNVVPASVLCTVDLRNPDDAQMRRAEQHVAAFLEELERSMGVTIRTRQTARTESVVFSDHVRGVIADKMRQAGLKHRHLVSGAGHDAQEMAALCPSGMIFVPGEFDGISHNPRERSTEQACSQGATVLYETLVALADEPD